MPRTPLLYASCLIAFACACSDPKCPPLYMQFGDTCRLCPPGEDREQGKCVPLRDGGDRDISDDIDVGDSAPEATESEPDSGDISGEDGDVSEADAEADASAPCYRDDDGDGAGAGDPIDCTQSDGSPLSTTNTDCDDSDPNRSPSLSDVCGDGIDNDCDGIADDEPNNACGGPCSTQLRHQPGEPCTNGLKGACSRTGMYECTSTTITCNAPSVAGSDERCGDNIDNDCDGTTDEPEAVDSHLWFQDCDGDGYSGLSDALISAGVGIKRACDRPSTDPACLGGWTERRPIARSTWDCDDTSTAYHPGAPFGIPPAARTSTDLNCDGVEEKEDAVGIQLIIEGAFDSIPRCSTSLSCLACGTNPDGSPRAAAQWIDASWQPTDTQPPCSLSVDNRFGSMQTLTLVGGFCPNGLWSFAAQDISVQKCR